MTTSKTTRLPYRKYTKDFILRMMTKAIEENITQSELLRREKLPASAINGMLGELEWHPTVAKYKAHIKAKAASIVSEAQKKRWNLAQTAAAPITAMNKAIEAMGKDLTTRTFRFTLADSTKIEADLTIEEVARIVRG